MTTVAVKDAGIGGSVREEFLPEPSWFARPIPGCGGETLPLTVAGIPVVLEGLSTGQAAALAARYGIFAKPAAPGARPELTIAVRKAGVPHFMQVQAHSGAVEYYRVASRWEDGALTVTSYEWAGWVDFSAGIARLALADSALSEARAFDRSLENFLRIVYAHLAVGKGGFLLHGAGLVIEGEAYLFFGPSGSGKTTVTSLTPEARILSDDLTLVVKEGGRYRACSVPFRGLFAPEATSDDRWPIRGFYRLVQAPADRLEPVSGARAVGELMGSLPFVTDRPEMAGAVMDAISAAAGQVPVARLHFRKDRTFWPLVRPEMSAIDSSDVIRGITP